MKKDDKSVVNENFTTSFTPPIIPVDEQQKTQEKEQSAKPKCYRDAIRKKE